LTNMGTRDAEHRRRPQLPSPLGARRRKNRKALCDFKGAFLKKFEYRNTDPCTYAWL
jgi:hypothetical protein